MSCRRVKGAAKRRSTSPPVNAIALSPALVISVTRQTPRSATGTAALNALRGGAGLFAERQDDRGRPEPEDDDGGADREEDQPARGGDATERPSGEPAELEVEEGEEGGGHGSLGTKSGPSARPLNACMERVCRVVLHCHVHCAMSRMFLNPSPRADRGGAEEDLFERRVGARLGKDVAGVLHLAEEQALAVVEDQQVGAQVLDEVEEVRTDQDGGAGAARSTTEAFIVRMPWGSRPVSGSSKRIARGSCTYAQQIATFWRIPRERSWATCCASA